MKKILTTFKKYIRALVPEQLLLIYHGVTAYTGAVLYGFPSKGMVIIGITGTKGKTTSANVMYSVLSTTYKTGLITTANIKIGDKERLNPWHMTMPGRFVIQKLLREMKDVGVTHVIIETTSEGLKQKRHVGIYYDVAVFTNLSPEHLPSHNNNYETYRKAKEVLFASIVKKKKKIPHTLSPTIIVNGDDIEAIHFKKHKADKYFSFGTGDTVEVKGVDVVQKGKLLTFSTLGKVYKVNAFGSYFIYNVLPALIVAKECAVNDEDISFALAHLPVIPGRMEVIDEGQNFLALVDYAHEKLSMTRLAETVHELKKENPLSRWIVLLGAEGGGRDKRKRADMGKVVGRMADIVIISNTDPYEEDEMAIAREIASYVEQYDKKEGSGYRIVLDRKEGIRVALAYAKKGDIVTITGNGSQQFFHRKGEKVPHDDRNVMREILREMRDTKGELFALKYSVSN